MTSELDRWESFLFDLALRAEGSPTHKTALAILDQLDEEFPEARKPRCEGTEEEYSLIWAYEDTIDRTFTIECRGESAEFFYRNRTTDETAGGLLQLPFTAGSGVSLYLFPLLLEWAKMDGVVLLEDET